MHLHICQRSWCDSAPAKHTRKTPVIEQAGSLLIALEGELTPGRTMGHLDKKLLEDLAALGALRGSHTSGAFSRWDAFRRQGQFPECRC